MSSDKQNDKGADTHKFMFGGQELTATRSSDGQKITIADGVDLKLKLVLGKLLPLKSTDGKNWHVTGTCDVASPFRDKAYVSKMLDAADKANALPRAA